MSIFNLGGKPEFVDPDKIKTAMFENRFFPPGLIHGGDYLILAYLNDAHCEDPESKDHDQFEVHYITKELVKDAVKRDKALGWKFYDTLYSESESFGVPNDGSGDFAELFEAWPHAVELAPNDLVSWANDSLTVLTKRQERCSDCFLLVEGQLEGTWVCDEAEKDVHDVNICPEGL